MIRRFFLSCVVLVFFSIFTAIQARAQTLPDEFISRFESIVRIEENTHLQIEERITFHTTTPRHGIYRYIPYRYERGSTRHTTDIENISVVNEKGTPYEFKTTRQDGMLNLRIGDPDETFTGEKTYVLRYEVKDALQQYQSADELYWDITGEGWEFPILSASTTVLSPYAEIGQMRCFTGEYGSTQSLCSFEHTAEGATFQANTLIDAGENFTIVTELRRPNNLNFPTEQERFWAQVLSYWWLPILCLPTLFLLFLWFKKGRDWMFLSPNVFADEERAPQQLKPLLHRFRIPLVYEPFSQLTPAEVGAIENENIESREIVAEIIDLARKKFLQIESTEKSGLLGTSLGKSTEYSLKKLSTPKNQQLPEHQAYLLKELFSKKETVAISSLRGKFSVQWAKFQELVWKSVTEKGYFSENPKKVQGLYIAIGIAALVLAFIIATALARESEMRLLPFFVVGMQVPLVIIFALAMPRKTARGVNVFLQARGLRETLKRGAWREKIKEKHLFIEEVFPFAIAFGVVDQLTQHMKQLGEEAPRYMSNAALHSASFQSFSNQFTSQLSSDLSYSPNSSSGSGGSGFSSGGGFSGGGGGGGGGGSW